MKWEKSELNKVILASKIKYVREHIRDWPSSYQRRNDQDEPRARETSLSELDGVVDILGHNLSWLHDADDQNKANINR